MIDKLNGVSENVWGVALIVLAGALAVVAAVLHDDKLFAVAFGASNAGAMAFKGASAK